MTSGVSVGTFWIVYWRYEQPFGHLLFHVVSVGSMGSVDVVVYVPSDGARRCVPSGVVGLFSVKTSTCTPAESMPLEKSQT